MDPNLTFPDRFSIAELNKTCPLNGMPLLWSTRVFVLKCGHCYNYRPAIPTNCYSYYIKDTLKNGCVVHNCKNPRTTMKMMDVYKKDKYLLDLLAEHGLTSSKEVQVMPEIGKLVNKQSGVLLKSIVHNKRKHIPEPQESQKNSKVISVKNSLDSRRGEIEIIDVDAEETIEQ